MNRAERRAAEREARAWVKAVQQRPDIPADTRAFAHVVAATAVRTGGSFTQDDVLDTLGMMQRSAD